MAAIILAAVAAGKWVEGWQRDKAVSEAVAPKDKIIAELSGKIGTLDASMVTITNNVENLGARLVDAKRFIAFADKYIIYLSSGQDPARSIFADHVCMLYRESQQSDVGLSMSTATVSRTLETAGAPGSRDLLIAMGLDPGLVDELIELQTTGIRRNLPKISRTVGYGVEPTRVGPVTVTPGQGSIPASEPRARKVVVDAARKLSGQSGQLVKVVTFHLEGRDYSYTMPPEIAGLVHNNPDCRLR